MLKTFGNYILYILITLSNTSTTFFIFPILYEYLTIYTQDSMLEIGLKVGVSNF
jgi:hypothetical protein